MPFNKIRLEEYLCNSSLSEAAKQYVAEAAVGPSRNVGESGFRCVAGAFQSRKMGCSISTESRGGEDAYTVALEYDRNVVAFYDQPPLVDCRRTDKNGRVTMRAYHPDLLVLELNKVEVVQVKSAGKLKSLLASNPADWQVIDGIATDLPANAAFLELGLPHRVVSVDELPRVRVANLRLLLRVREDESRPDSRIQSSILAATSESAVVSISALAEKIGTKDLTPILSLIDQELLFADIDNCLLSAPETCWISRSSLVLAEFINSQTGVDRFPSNVANESVSLSEVPPLRQATKALEILERLKANENSRSGRRWRRRIQAGLRCGESAFQAVLPRTFMSGNRTSKRPLQVLAFAEDVVRTKWATPEQPSKKTTYSTYLLRAEEWHPALEPVSAQTFSKITREIRDLCALGRGGRRPANAAAAPSDVSDRIIRPQRPFELASCDHCLAKLFVVVFRTEKWVYVQRPWLTALVDCSTGKSLASWLSLRRPSKISCAMVLRQCLRRHGRLPEGIIADRGSEFRSVFFYSLLAHCAINLYKRPTSDCRYGAEAERYFGLFKTLWLDARPGNITHYKNARAVSGSHSPSAFAQIELRHLVEELANFDEWLDGRLPGSQLATANDKMAQGLQQYPFSGRKLPFDQAFQVVSAVDNRTFKLDPSRGIQVDHRWYWGPALRAERLRRKDVQVRLEPEDYTRVYVKTNDWSICQSSQAPTISFEGHYARLAESLIVDGAGKARAKADKDSRIELARLLRDADEALKMDSMPDDSSANDDSDGATDPFDDVKNAELDELQRSGWRSS